MTMVKVEEEENIRYWCYFSKTKKKSVPFCNSSRLMIFTLQSCHLSQISRVKRCFSWGKIFEGTYELVLEYNQIYPNI